VGNYKNIALRNLHGKRLLLRPKGKQMHKLGRQNMGDPGVDGRIT
jgi:hypothetical protein